MAAPLYCSCWPRMREVSRNGFVIGVNATRVDDSAFRVQCIDCKTVYSLLPTSPVAVLHHEQPQLSRAVA